MSPPLDRDRLRLACREVARNIESRRGPVSDAVASAFAEVLIEEALFYEEYLLGQDRDPNVSTSAINYLAHVHAIPPMGVDVSWFRDSLAVLIELACPNAAGSRQDEQLYKEIERGIQLARDDYET